MLIYCIKYYGQTNYHYRRSSGIGYEVAKIYWKRGYQLGLAGRRVDRLEEFRKQDPEHIQIKQLDVTAEDAADRLDELIRDLGGMDSSCLVQGSATK